MKVDVRSADIYNSRFTHGLYVQYGCTFAGENKDHHKTGHKKDTLKPVWNDSRLVSIANVTDAVIEAFESDSINFTVFGVQKEGSGAKPKVFLFPHCQNFTTFFKLTTRELKERQGVTTGGNNDSVKNSSQWGFILNRLLVERLEEYREPYSV